MINAHARKVAYDKDTDGPNKTKSIKGIEWLAEMKVSRNPDKVKLPKIHDATWSDLLARTDRRRERIEMSDERFAVFDVPSRAEAYNQVLVHSGYVHVLPGKNRLGVLWPASLPNAGIDIGKLVESYVEARPAIPVWSEALQEIEDIVRVASESGYELPDQKAIDNAIRLLHAIPSDFHLIQNGVDIPEPMVYPTQDREVAIHMSRELGQSVIVLCDSNGGMLCLAGIDGNRRRAYYRKAQQHVDGFLRDALRDLGGRKLDVLGEHYVG